jgi:hypothetical protein
MKIGVGISEHELDRLEQEQIKNFDTSRVRWINTLLKLKNIGFDVSKALLSLHESVALEPNNYPKTKAKLDSLKKVGE